MDGNNNYTTILQAVKNWEDKHGRTAGESNEIKLCCQLPPIAKMDKSLANLKNCEILSLSTNSIDRVTGLAGMTKLRVLSLGRNNLKKIEKLEDVAGTLQQLWISYNQISSLEGLACLLELSTLYISNNVLKSFSFLFELSPLKKLREVMLIGNPMYDDIVDKAETRILVLKYLPQLTKIDGQIVKPSEVEMAKKLLDE